ncbi:hypothetical protein AKJ41_05285 [candidate division MSBL1 archaeon SCGC-AAA259O05]|uniref:Glycoside hydrolase family 38 central domain-containing protein n=1 Tax=candidate division MSBL1 archaeon SCGC-AAA259O05 TaxID=1698271 RepID=A0A133UZD4_9EURY|nr:hypothetical protein AKJ41_05285 [candidate division MSBL1 archaeon SCGC-AAA259O05]
MEKRADKTESILENLFIDRATEIEEIGYYETKEFGKPEDVRDKEFSECEVGFTWSRERDRGADDRLNADVDLLSADELPRNLSIGNNLWFNLRVVIPEDMAGDPVYLRFAVKPEESPKLSPGKDKPEIESLCYQDGEPIQAFDQGHDSLLLTEEAEGGEVYNLLIEVGNTMLWGGLDVGKFILDAAEIYSVIEEVETFYWNFKILNDLRKQLDGDSPYYRKILKCLQKASEVFPLQSEDNEELKEGAEEAMEKLQPAKDVSTEISEFDLITTGHAHIDAAWLWPWSETVRKCGRTFSTVLKLMEENPEFTFLQSQPHLYEFTRERYPKVYEKIKERAEEGRWEPVGALWVESDVNVSGPESLARQYLLGKKYFREKFDVDPKITFIPDVFGYSAALPNIASSADCPYFFTQKMSWNEINEFPHHTFLWEGTGGSKVLAHFPPADTYGGMTLTNTVEEVKKSAETFKESSELDKASYLIGWSDGGGGPNRDMITQIEVINEVDALPNLKFGSLKNFFGYLDDHKDDLPKWVGELYLEKHRGTLTTQAKTKRNNRKGEFALKNAEILSSLALIREDDFEYPKQELTDAWKIFLFNQFHDILPGSSIRDVYYDAERDYSTVFEKAEEKKNEAFNTLVTESESTEYVTVFNPLSWERDTIVPVEYSTPPSGLLTLDAEGEEEPVQVSGKSENEILINARKLPSMGIKTFRIREDDNSRESNLWADKYHLENSLIRLEFDNDGYIKSLYDKELDRQVLKDKGNKLVAYRDIPAKFDAWDIEEDLYEVGETLNAPEKIEVIEEGPLRATLRQTRLIGDSKIIQDIMVYKDSKRIDFDTRVDWHERDTFLKTHFPVDVYTNEATFEVQYGNVKRPTHSNTSWDRAKFEVPHQKWVDVSEYDYGAALLNDCKYGARVDGTDVNLSLLRSPQSPDPEADQREHKFMYSLLPHQGNFQESGVIEEAYDLNVPTDYYFVEDMEGSDSLLNVDGPGIIVEAVKRSEDKERELIFRFYEAWGRRTSANIVFNFDVDEIYETNLVEDKKKKLETDEKEIEISFDPFEIKTLSVEF